jgi:zinc D-Ala-D-Ala carboxypeptidase
MKLTQNFSLSELTRSQTATRKGIVNQPNDEQLANLVALCECVLQPIRDHFGTSVRISSGLRVPELNAAIGGSTTSDHTRGCAADIEVPPVDNLRACSVDRGFWPCLSPTDLGVLRRHPGQRLDSRQL